MVKLYLNISVIQLNLNKTKLLFRIMVINSSQPNKSMNGSTAIILSLLKESGLKQTDLANRLSVDKSYINRIIHSKEEAPTLMKIKIAKALRVDSRVIWDDKK